MQEASSARVSGGAEDKLSVVGGSSGLSGGTARTATVEPLNADTFGTSE